MINVEEGELCRKGKSSADRAILMELLYRCCNMKQPEIGRMVGGMDYSSVSVARKQLRIQMKKDLSLKQKVEKLLINFSRLKIPIADLAGKMFNGYWAENPTFAAGFSTILTSFSQI